MHWSITWETVGQRLNTELRSWLEPTGWPGPSLPLSQLKTPGWKKGLRWQSIPVLKSSLSLKHPQSPSPGCDLGAEPWPTQPPSLAQSPSSPAADQTGGGPLLSYHMRLFKNSRQRKEKTYCFTRLP